MKGLYILKDGDCVPYTFKGRVVLVGVPGAFTPTCTDSHLPGFADNLEDLKSLNIDKVAFFSVNDAMVMDAWNIAHGHKDIDAISDPLAVFSKSIGEDVDFGETFGIRCNRCAYLVEDNEIIKKFKDPFIQGVIEELND